MNRPAASSGVSPGRIILSIRRKQRGIRPEEIKFQILDFRINYNYLHSCLSMNNLIKSYRFVINISFCRCPSGSAPGI
jgi:hypothetical protein